MPQYKLIYFDFKGRGEPIRIMFAAAGVKYEDCRLSREEFKEIKASKLRCIYLTRRHVTLLGSARNLLTYGLNQKDLV